MDGQVKKNVLGFLFALIVNVSFAQTNFSFFKVEDGIHYSQDNGLTWCTATNRSVIFPSTLINNSLGKRYALVDNSTDMVYWSEMEGKATVIEIINSILQKDNFFSALFSEIRSSNESNITARYDRRGGVKMGHNHIYIESVAAHKLRCSSHITDAVRYRRIKVSNKTFYFEFINTTEQALQFVLVQYDKKHKHWSIPLNYKNGDREIVLILPAKSVISLKQLVFKSNSKKKYYLVAIDERLQLSWQNLQKELNSYCIRPTHDTNEASLYIYTAD